MLEPFVTILANDLKDIEVSLGNALMNQNTVNFHQTGNAASWAQSELLRAFADFQFRPRTQPVTSAQRFRKNHSAEFVQFELHVDIMPYQIGNGKSKCQ